MRSVYYDLYSFFVTKPLHLATDCTYYDYDSRIVRFPRFFAMLPSYLVVLGGVIVIVLAI
jgi:hypothetical protein